MTLLPNRRWLRYSLRTLLVTVTVFCVWLGCQVSIVRERRALRAVLMDRREMYIAVDPVADERMKWPPRKKYHMPTVRRLLGDSTFYFIEVSDPTPAGLLERIDAAFPEAQIDIRRGDERTMHRPGPYYSDSATCGYLPPD